MSIGAKQAMARELVAEPPMACPADCGVTVTPADLQTHIAERCPGPREPGPAAGWVDRQAAVALGVPPRTLSYWARTGKVRSRGAPMDRKYLLRDLARRVVIRRLDRRRLGK
jgi:hypothetical protein